MERSILKRGVHMWLMVALAASPTVAAQVPVELDKGSIYAHVVDAGAELHRCPSTQTRCRFVVPPGPALLQVVFRGGDKRERTLRLVDGVGVRVGISAKNTAALYATISGVATAVLGYAVLLPLGLEDFDTGLLVAGLTLGTMGALTTVIAGPIYAASGPRLSTRPIPASPAGMGVKVSGRF